MMLSDKQKLFCKEYLKDLNASQAAARAGYSKNTYLLNNPEIKNYIIKLIRRKSSENNTDSSADMLIGELESIAFANDVKFSGRDKLRAIELLGKIFGIFDNPRNPEAEQNIRSLMEALKNDSQ